MNQHFLCNNYEVILVDIYMTHIKNINNTFILKLMYYNL